MQPTGERIDEPPLEADAADAQEQARDLIDVEDDGDDGDRERGGPDLSNLDLNNASEADLAEQLSEVGFDDDADR